MNIECDEIISIWKFFDLCSMVKIDCINMVTLFTDQHQPMHVGILEIPLFIVQLFVFTYAQSFKITNN